MISAILGNFSLMKTFCHHLSGINLGKENKTILNQKAGSCKTSELIHPFPFFLPILLQAPCREYINLTCLGIYIRLLSITRDFRFLYSPPMLYFCKRVLNKSNFTFFFSHSGGRGAKNKSLDYSVPPLELVCQCIRIQICYFCLNMHELPEYYICRYTFLLAKSALLLFSI